MTQHVGVLAYGSLLTSPGWELEDVTDRRVENEPTPFNVEFARASNGRGGAPTLVPVVQGGSPVIATVLVMEEGVDLQTARNITYRRERDKVGDSACVYEHRDDPTPNQIHLPVLDGPLAGIGKVIYTVIGDTIPSSMRTPTCLGHAALKSINGAAAGRDGITYLRDAISMGISTPLTEGYRSEILRLTETKSLDDAIIAASTMDLA